MRLDLFITPTFIFWKIVLIPLFGIKLFGEIFEVQQYFY